MQGAPFWRGDKRVSVLGTRVLLGVVMFAVFFGVVIIDAIFHTDIGFGCLAALAGAMGLREFYAITKKKDFSPFCFTGIGIGLWLFVAYWLSVRKHPPLGCQFFRPEIVLIFIFSLLLIQTYIRGTKDAVKNISVTIFGVFYVFYLLSFALALRYLSNGAGLLILVLLISKFGDIGGYLLGRKYGKHKLSKVISPNKTVEGACFALLSSVLIAVIFNLILSTRVMSVPWSALFGLVVGFAAMMGDLAESLLKRDLQVKDSGGLLPAFGGVLDVIDCLLISMPVAYYFLVYSHLASS